MANTSRAFESEENIPEVVEVKNGSSQLPFMSPELSFQSYTMCKPRGLLSPGLVRRKIEQSEFDETCYSKKSREILLSDNNLIIFKEMEHTAHRDSAGHPRQRARKPMNSS